MTLIPWTLEAGPADILVRARPEDINTTNLQDAELSLYTLRHKLTKEPYSIPEPAKGIPVCHFCHRVFSTFSECEIHKGRFCRTEKLSIVEDADIIQVLFDLDQLFFIQDCLKSLKLEVLEVEKLPEKRYFEVHKNDLTFTLRQLYMAQVSKYNLEQWYPAFEELGKECGEVFTPKSLFVSLSEDELKTIRKYCSIRLSEALGMPTRELNSEMEAREKLENRIEDLMEKGKEYFVKFSTRSPKDAISSKVDEKDKDIADAINRKYKSLKVTSAEEAFELLIRSQRIFTDIENMFRFGVKECSSSKLNIILREWMPMTQELEFRCYVHQGKLCAISQYHCYYKFDILQSREFVLKVREVIKEFHSKVKKAIKISSYVFDVGLSLKESAKGDTVFSCNMIELNPFGASMSSGSCLFHWKHHYDILYGKVEEALLPVIWVLGEAVAEKDTDK